MPTFPRISPPWAWALLLALTACGGRSHATGDQAGQVNQAMAVSPASATMAPGQTLRFSLGAPWGGDATWSVVPATAGSISATGMFTASGQPGSYTIVAVWNKDVRYTGSAALTLLPPATPAETTPDLAAVAGGLQTGGATPTRNTAVVGEAVPASVGTDPTGTTQNRSGFQPVAK